MQRTALVTGGGSGIGRAIVAALARDAWVATLDLSYSEPTSAEVDLEVDVTNRSAVAEAVEDITSRNEGIDWVVCAAGIIKDRVSWKMSDADWDDVLTVNLTGAFNVARAAIPALRESPCGRLIFIGSINGVRGSFGQANYAASKAGLIGLARSLAHELGRDGVTVNVVTPGFIDTPMTRTLSAEIRERAVNRTPLRCIGQPNDVAAAVRFLCQEAAGFITGAVLPVDGGQLMGAVV